MVEIKGRIPWRQKHISTRIAAKDVMSRNVYANGGVVGRMGEAALENSLKHVHLARRVRSENQLGGVAKGGSHPRHVRIQIPLDAPRLVYRCVVVYNLVQSAGDRQFLGPEVDCHVDKRARVDAAAACPWWIAPDRRLAGNLHHEIAMRYRCAVTAYRCVRAVKEGRVFGGVDVKAPFPVWEGARVAAGAEGFLVGVDEEAVPGEEVALSSCMSYLGT